MFDRFAAVGLTLALLSGCPWRRPAPLAGPIPLGHRYEESIVLDKATPNCWYSRPLPDSLSLEGYDGIRYIARLSNVPTNARYVCHYRIVNLPVDEVANAANAQKEVSVGPGASIPTECDVVWDIFWKRKEPGTIEFRDRFEVIQEKDQTIFVTNRSVVQVNPVHIPREFSQGINSSFYGALPVRYEEVQTPFALNCLAAGATSDRIGPGVRIEWCFKCGKWAD